MINLVNHIALRASDKFALGFPLSCAALNVGDRRFVEAHLQNHGAVDLGVQVLVPAVIDPVLDGAHIGEG